VEEKKIGTSREWSKTRSRNQIVAEELEIGFEEGQKGVKGDMNVNAHAEAIGSTRI